MKKQKAKKGGAKKKEDKDAEASTSKEIEDAKEDVETAEAEAAEADEEKEKGSPKRPHGRQPSMSVQSKLRSESFRKEGPKSPTGPGAASGLGSVDLAQRVEELEKENKRLAGEKEDAEKRWHKLEEELQELREADGESVGLKEKARLAEEHTAELEKLVRST